MNTSILVTEHEVGYELLDSGNGKKLERYGDVIISRPDPQALWAEEQSHEKWNKAHAKFVVEEKQGKWHIQKDVPERWKISIAGFTMWIRPTSFKHTGLFPEHVPNWKWIENTLAGFKKQYPHLQLPKVLNLFGYTGGATLAAAREGAEVVHVDGSKTAVTWARDNAEASGLGSHPIRWILDDVRAFVSRELKRGNTYDGIIMDPPAFGHGADKQVWNIEKDLMPLIEDCKKILSQHPAFFLLNGYASGYSSLAYKNILEKSMSGYKGSIECGELTIKESSSQRLLPAGIFARWRASF